MDGPSGWSDNYADSVLPEEGDTDDQEQVIGEHMTWWQYWSNIQAAYEAGWERCRREVRNSL
jgi:hypothetical protein